MSRQGGKIGKNGGRNRILYWFYSQYLVCFLEHNTFSSGIQFH
jgi:hypothetical protein